MRLTIIGPVFNGCAYKGRSSLPRLEVRLSLTTLTSGSDVLSSRFSHHSSGASTASMEGNYFIKHYGMDTSVK